MDSGVPLKAPVVTGAVQIPLNTLLPQAELSSPTQEHYFIYFFIHSSSLSTSS